jgi:acetylornithine deacetylase/succinyl-diaminopimelate desuccinylase-like protein
VQATNPVKCDETLTNTLVASVQAAGFEVEKLISGAGHDAVAISDVSPVSMMFVRCFRGISHNPLEDVEVKDIAAAIQVGDKYIENLIKTYNN